jgi:rod shape-determining protein MreB
MFGFLSKYFSNDLAIDLGTANTLIYVRAGHCPRRAIGRRHPPRRRPQCQKTIQAVGKEAKEMLGKAPGTITVIRPMKDGVIADFTVTEQMLKQFIKKVHDSKLFSPSPRIIICVPSGSTQVERRAIRESALGAGASQVYLIEEPMAAAIGAGLPVSEATGSMVVDIGGGTTEVGVISLGGMVYAGSVRVGGDKLDEAIINYISRNYGMMIGENTAENIKKNIGSAFPGAEVKEMEVSGINKAEGIPRKFHFLQRNPRSTDGPVEPGCFRREIGSGKDAAGTRGRHCRKGHGADRWWRAIARLDRLLMEETGLPVIVADEPLTCVARGCGMALEKMDKLGSIFASD